MGGPNPERIALLIINIMLPVDREAIDRQPSNVSQIRSTFRRSRCIFLFRSRTSVRFSKLAVTFPGASRDFLVFSVWKYQECWQQSGRDPSRDPGPGHAKKTKKEGRPPPTPRPGAGGRPAEKSAEKLAGTGGPRAEWGPPKNTTKTRPQTLRGKARKKGQKKAVFKKTRKGGCRQGGSKKDQERMRPKSRLRSDGFFRGD